MEAAGSVRERERAVGLGVTADELLAVPHG
jgi:hypothetical protein